jgi:hypothetical protein
MSARVNNDQARGTSQFGGNAIGAPRGGPGADGGRDGLADAAGDDTGQTSTARAWSDRIKGRIGEKPHVIAGLVDKTGPCAGARSRQMGNLVGPLIGIDASGARSPHCLGFSS